MKALFQNKKFRKNLYKWLFMYIGVMSLTTTVITYSKYISSFKSEDSARVAKFDISVEPTKITCTDGEVESEVKKICNMGVIRPTAPFDYYFDIDTTNMEVKTNLIVTIYVNSNFKLISDNPDGGELVYNLYDIDIAGKVNNKVPLHTYDSNISINGKSDKYTIYTTNVIEILPGQGSKKSYKLSLKYAGDVNNVATEKLYDVVFVGYSAKQVIN